MLTDALHGDQLIAMPVLGKKESDGPPPLKPIACLTKIVSHQPLPDGCSNILVIGLARIRLVNELPAWEPYRQAEAIPLEEQDGLSDERQTSRIRDHLLATFKQHLAVEVEDLSCLDGLLERELSLAVLTDLMAHTLPLDFQLKNQLLAETDVEHRAAMLQQSLTEPVPRSTQSLLPVGSFPPGFSAN